MDQNGEIEKRRAVHAVCVVSLDLSCSYVASPMNFYLPFWLMFAEVRIEASKRPDQEPPRGHKAVVLTQQHPKLKMISGDLPTYWKEFQTVRNPNVGFRCQT